MKSSLKDYVKKILGIFPTNKIELTIISIIIIFSSFMRLYKISEYLTFLGDEGRDVLIAREIMHGNLTLLGPRASAGDFFLGPIYYYMIAPFLWIFNYDPVGPAVFVALVGIATVYLVYFVGKTFFGTKAGIFAASLYAVSPLVIRYSRSSWNPNPMPFVSLLSLLVLYHALKKNSWRLFVIVGFLLGIAMQLHYLSTFLAVIITTSTIMGVIIEKRQRIIFTIIKNLFQIGIGFAVGILPFLLFEIRHFFPNTKTILNFIFLDNANEIYDAYGSFMGTVNDVLFRLFARLLLRFPPPEQVSISQDPWLMFLQILTFVIIMFSLFALLRNKDKLSSLIVMLSFVLGVGLFGFYKREIYDYYLGFIFPLPFLLFGNLASKIGELITYKKIGVLIASCLIIVLFIYNFQGQPFQFQPNNQKGQTEKIASFILQKAERKPFNFALISGGNSDHAYRYFFEVNGMNPISIENFEIDPHRNSVTNQLFVICEGGPCAPLGNSLWEIAGFGRAEISDEWQVSVVKVYKLVPYSE